MNRGLRRELGLLAGLGAVGMLLAGRKSWAATLGLCAAGLQMLPSETFSFEERVVVITGGSRGLGLALARKFLREGAFVALLARDPDELDRAKVQLEEEAPGCRIMTIPCDLTQSEEARQALLQVQAEWGCLDVLVNNAGTISVGPFEAMDPPDFDALLNLQVHAVVNAVQTVIPLFRQAGGGRIVNISSIGGRVPVPHMASYCAGKFALAGLSESFAAELAVDNIKVTTVFPGLMRTGSPIQAVFKGDHEKEYGWFAASDVMPGVSVSAEYAARQIVDGVRHGDAEVRFPWITHVGILGHALLPETYAMVNRQAARFLPKGLSHARKTGAQSQNWLERQFWYKPLKGLEHRAEESLNQREKFDANFNLGI